MTSVARTRLSAKRRETRKSAKPLAGTRVLVGRAKHQAGSLSKELRKLGADILEIPFIEIRRPRSYLPLDTVLKNLTSYDWLVLTSVNGVEAMWERVGRWQISKKALRHLRIAAIGPATKKAIEKHGVRVDVVPEEYVAESVVKSLRRLVKGKRILLVRAKVARDVIPNELCKAGAVVDVVEAYETVVPNSSRMRLRAVLKDARKRPHVVTFTSSSTVKNFVELLGVRSRERKRPAALQGITFASIGPVTSTTLRDLGLGVDIQAKQFSIPGLVAAIVARAK